MTVRRILQLVRSNADKRKEQLAQNRRDQLEEEARKRRQQPDNTKQLRG